MTRKILSILFLTLMALGTVWADDFETEGRAWLKKANDNYARGYYDVAVGFYLKAAEFHIVEAQFYLGYALYVGEGIDQSYPSAAMWFKRAAAQGYPQAEYNLAYCYMEGHGVPRDYVKSKPVVGKKVDKLYNIPGNVPNPVAMPDYCYFRDRCEMKCGSECDGEYPCEISLSPTHKVSCYRYYDNKGKEDQK